MRWSWGGKSADKAVCAAECLALSGRQRGRSSRRGPAWQGYGGGCKRPLVAAGVSGQHPCPVVAGEAAADEVAQVEGGGAVLEPGVVPGGAEVAESPEFSQARRIM
jgi:hypothetical protein